MNDPFGEEVEIHISIVPTRGNKKGTKVTGFKTDQFDKEELKKHFTNIKSTVACGGNFSEDKDKKEYFFLLQGDHLDKVKQAIIKQNIVTEDCIKTHG